NSFVLYLYLTICSSELLLLRYQPIVGHAFLPEIRRNFVGICDVAMPAAYARPTGFSSSLDR
ncbi:hypothetical protein L9F63_019220, partial [Diploptera punctata]